MQFKFGGPKPPLPVTAAAVLAIFEGGLFALAGFFYLIITLFLGSSVSFGNNLAQAQEGVIAVLYVLLGVAVLVAALATFRLHVTWRQILVWLQLPVIILPVFNGATWVTIAACFIYAAVIAALLFLPPASKQAFSAPAKPATGTPSSTATE